MIKILIADDHEIVREGLRYFIEKFDDMEVVGEAGNGQEALSQCANKNPDVVLLDLDMPGMSGLDVIDKIVSQNPNSKILILTMHDNEEYAIRALRAGAAGFILKGSRHGELPAAIRQVAAGKPFVTLSIMEKIALRHTTPAKDDPVSFLSTRELQVLRKLALGLLLRDIAEEMNLSINTVASYKKRIRDKLNLNKDSELIRFAKDHGLID